MPDASLAAALLGLQRRRSDPLESRRKYGEQIMQQGASTAPLGSGSPLEGIARALQGAVGGYFAGQADREEEAQGQSNVKVLSDALGAPDQQSMAAILKNYKGDASLIMPIVGQLLAQRMGQFQNADKAAQFAAGYTANNGAPASPPSSAPGVPQPGYAAATAPGGVASSNVGNITDGKGGFRQYATPQAGTVDLVSLLRSYPVQYNQGQPMTLMQIGQRYAPADDGKDPMLRGNDPAIWARNVGQIAGIDPSQPLDFDNPAVVSAVVRGINGQEKGGSRQQPGVLAQGVQQAMDPTAFPSAGVPGPIAQPPIQLAQGDAPPAAPPSASSGAPDIPRPQPTAEQIAKYKGLIASGQMTGAQAVQALDREVTQQWQMDKTRALEVWKDQQASKRQNEKAAIDLGQKAPMEMIAKRVDAYEKDIRPRAQAAVQEIGSIHQVRQLLDAGVFTGMGANAQAFGSRIAQILPGVDWGADKQANTAALQSAMGARVLGLVKQLGAGAGISNADRDYAERVAGGEISVGEPAIRKILDIGERAARATLKAHDAEAERLRQLPGMAQLGDQQFSVQAAPTYEEFVKANPLPSANAPGAAPAPAAPQQDGGDVLGQARAAIAKGAPRDKVIERLRSMGINPEGL